MNEICPICQKEFKPDEWVTRIFQVGKHTNFDFNRTYAVSHREVIMAHVKCPEEWTEVDLNFNYVAPPRST